MTGGCVYERGPPKSVNPSHVPESPPYRRKNGYWPLERNTERVASVRAWPWRAVRSAAVATSSGPALRRQSDVRRKRQLDWSYHDLDTLASRISVGRRRRWSTRAWQKEQ